MSSKSAPVPTAIDYPPDTRVDWTITVPGEYPLTGKEAVFELRTSDDTAVTFRYRSGTDSQLEITGQTVSVSIAPDTASADALGNTLAEALALASEIQFNLDLGVDGSDYTDYRIQGVFRILETHGKY